MKKEAKPTEAQDLPKETIISIFIIIAAVIAAWILSVASNKRKALKSKGQLAAEYNIKLDVFLKWINLFCPTWYAKAYARTAIKKIPEYDIYRALGKPEPDKVFSKEALAKECYVSRNTLTNHIKSISDFQNKVGISIEQYLSMRVFPPRIFKLIKETHDAKFLIDNP